MTSRHRGYQKPGKAPDDFSNAFISSVPWKDDEIAAGKFVNALWEFFRLDKGFCGDAKVHKDVDGWKAYRRERNIDHSAQFLTAVVEHFIMDQRRRASFDRPGGTTVTDMARSVVRRASFVDFLAHYGSLSLCMHNIAENFLKPPEDDGGRYRPYDWVTPASVSESELNSVVDTAASDPETVGIPLANRVFAIAPVTGNPGVFAFVSSFPEVSSDSGFGTRWITIELLQKERKGDAVNWVLDWTYVAKEAGRHASADVSRHVFLLLPELGKGGQYRPNTVLQSKFGFRGNVLYSPVTISYVRRTPVKRDAKVLTNDGSRRTKALFITHLA